LLNKIGEDLAAEDRERRTAAKARMLATEDSQSQQSPIIASVLV
jgi:hypothetical protein